MIKKLFIWITNTRLYAWILLKIIPEVRFTTALPSIKGHKYFEGYDKLEAGDIILCRENKKLTSLLIGGLFTHAAFCVNKRNEFDQDFEIAEMTKDNYTKSYFYDICKEADRVVILRCRNFDPSYTKEVIKKCLSFHNVNYNIHFTLGIKELYCSELVYQSDFERRLKVELTYMPELGMSYISPTDLYKTKTVDIIWDSDNSN